MGGEFWVAVAVALAALGMWFWSDRDVDRAYQDMRVVASTAAERIENRDLRIRELEAIIRLQRWEIGRLSGPGVDAEWADICANGWAS